MIPNNILQIISSINPCINGIDKAQTPDEAAQILLNSGAVNQNQVNQAKQMWGNPQVRQMIQNKYHF